MTLLLLALACHVSPGRPARPVTGSAATAAPVTLRFQYQCPGAAWADLVLGARDCTGRYPMFPEGDYSDSWCPRFVGALPDVPWRRAQAGTAEWRVVDQAGAVRSTITGPCVDDRRVYDHARKAWCGGDATRSLRAMHRRCGPTEFHTALALFTTTLEYYPHQFVIFDLLRMPPYHVPG